MAEVELPTPCRGPRKKRTTVTAPRKARAGRTEPSARRRLGSGAETLAEVAAEEAGACSQGRRPSQQPPAPGDDTAFPPHPALSVSPRFIPGRAQPADSLQERITRRGGPESLGCEHPSARGPDPSRAADPFGMEGWELGRGALMLPEAPPEARETVSSHPGEKSEGISAKATSHPGPDSNFPPRVGSCTTRRDPAEAARTQVPTSPGRAGSGQSQSTSGGKGWRARAAAERRRRRPIRSQGGSPCSPR